MQLITILKRLAATSFVLTVVGCSIEVPNVRGCVELTRDRAFCKETISGDESRIEAEVWRKLRVGRISLSPDDWGQVLRFIESACEITSRCTQEETKKASDFLDRFKGVNQP